MFLIDMVPLANKNLSMKKGGFTLVEMLVAVSILVVAIGAPLFIAARGINLAITTKDRITATFLAEEAMELIRNRRDSNILKIVAGIQPPSFWSNGFLACSGAGGCYIDVYQTGGIFPCTSPCPRIINFVEVGTSPNIERKYGDSFSTSSKFTRSVVYVPGPSAYEGTIYVTVSWDENGQPLNVTLQELIYSWQ